MNKIIRLLLGSMAISLLAGCLSTEDQNVENVSISNPSELYGTWIYKSQDAVTGYLGDNTTPYYFVLSDVRSYFIQGGASSDSSFGSFTLIPLQWSLSKGNVLTFSPNVSRFIHSLRSPQPPVYRDQVKGIDSAQVYTVSNVDSIVTAFHILDSLNLVNNPYESIESVDSTSIVIIQHLKDSEHLVRGYEQINTVKEYCYQAHEGATNMKDLCEVTVYEKDANLDLTGLLSKVDTLSSTVVWQDLMLQ